MNKETSIEEYQKIMLDLQAKIENYKSSIDQHEEKYADLKNTYEETQRTLNDTRELNAKLSLKIASQTLTPKEETKPQQGDKILSFDEILKNL